MVSEQDDDPGLTPRERTVLEHIACVLTAKEVARELGIAPRTVERHIENVRHKMRARNKSHMIAKAIISGDLAFDQTAAKRPATPAERPRLIIAR